MTLNIEIIIVLILITLILIGIAFLIYRGLRTRVLKLRELAKLTEDMRLERIQKADSILSRVSIVVKGNSQFKDVFETLKKQYDDMEVIIDNARKLFEELMEKKNKINRKNFYKKINELNSIILKINNSERIFKKTSSIITQQDDFLSSELVFYSSRLRVGIEVYRLKRILLSRLSNKIDGLLDLIKNKENLFNNALELAQNKMASEHLSLYIKQVTAFVKIISEAPQIETYIYTTIPKIIMDLTNTYKEKKKQLSAPLKHINFKDSLIEMSKLFDDAKKQYELLNFDKTKEIIKKILKSIKILKRMINFEIISRNFFIDNYELTISETKRVLKKYFSLKQQIKMIILRGEAISSELTSLMSETNILSKQIDNQALSFRDSMKNKEIPYSSKLSRMKILMQKNSLLILNINEILEYLWSINIEESLIKNKFSKSESAVNEILANMKKSNVKFVGEQKDEYEYLSKNINYISEKIQLSQYDKDLRDETNNLMESTSTFYMAVNGNIQIAEISSNLIKEFAPLRATDARLNIMLSNSERSYLEGEYAHALNTIIEELERRGE